MQRLPYVLLLQMPGTKFVSSDLLISTSCMVYYEISSLKWEPLTGFLQGCCGTPWQTQRQTEYSSIWLVPDLLVAFGYVTFVGNTALQYVCDKLYISYVDIFGCHPSTAAGGSQSGLPRAVDARCFDHSRALPKAASAAPSTTAADAAGNLARAPLGPTRGLTGASTNPN